MDIFTVKLSFDDFFLQIKKWSFDILIDILGVFIIKCNKKNIFLVPETSQEGESTRSECALPRFIISKHDIVGGQFFKMSC